MAQVGWFKRSLYAVIAIGLGLICRACAQDAVLSDAPMEREGKWAIMGDQNIGYIMSGVVVSSSTESLRQEAIPDAPSSVDRGHWETTVCLDSENSHICVPARVLTGTCETVDGSVSDCPPNAHDPVPSRWHVVSKKITWASPPDPRTHEEFTGKSARFYTYRKSFKNPPLRTNRQLFTSPSFVIPQAAMFTSMAFACHNKRSGEHCPGEAIAVTGLFVMNYAQARFISGLHAMGTALYGTGYYIRKAAR